MKVKTLLLIVVISACSTSVQAGPLRGLNAVARFLGLGWSNGYHSHNGYYPPTYYPYEVDPRHGAPVGNSYAPSVTHTPNLNTPSDLPSPESIPPQAPQQTPLQRVPQQQVPMQSVPQEWLQKPGDDRAWRPLPWQVR